MNNGVGRCDRRALATGSSYAIRADSRWVFTSKHQTRARYDGLRFRSSVLWHCDAGVTLRMSFRRYTSDAGMETVFLECNQKQIALRTPDYLLER